MPSASTDHTLLIALVALFLVNSPFTAWWARLSLPWYAMFILWAVIIALVAVNQWRINRGD